MANPFLIGDSTSTLNDSNNTFNPFLTSASSDLEPHNDNPFFSTFASSNSSTQDNTNPFLAFSQTTEQAHPVADLLGINEKPQATVLEDTTKMKPPPPRPAPPKRPPPRPTPPSHDAKELIFNVTGEMDATSLHLLDRLTKTPSPTPLRDLLTPSPTPTADLLGCEDLQPPTTSQVSSVFDQQPNIIDFPSGSKPDRPKFPPKIDFLMDDLLEDVPIDEDLQLADNLMQKRTPSIPENHPIGGSKPTSRKSSNEFIPTQRRLSHDVTESRKIMPDMSKISDRRKSDIGHFAPILPSRKPTSQSDQYIQNIKPDNSIQEIYESEDKSNVEECNNVTENILVPTEEIEEEKKIEEIIPQPHEPTDVAWKDENIEQDVYNDQQHTESPNQFETDTAITITKPIPSAAESTAIESTVNENVQFDAFDANTTLPSSESFHSSDGIVKEKYIDEYNAKTIPPVPDPSPFQEMPPQETSFNAVFEVSEKIATTAFDILEPQQSDSVNATLSTIPESSSLSTVIKNDDAFDAFAAKFDDSQNDSNASGGAFDAFGSVAGGAFEDSAVGFGADDNFDSFLSTHQIPSAPQSTPAKVTRNNSGESLDENDFNVFIRLINLTYKYMFLIL